MTYRAHIYREYIKLYTRLVASEFNWNFNFNWNPKDKIIFNYAYTYNIRARWDVALSQSYVYTHLYGVVNIYIFFFVCGSRHNADVLDVQGSECEYKLKGALFFLSLIYIMPLLIAAACSRAQYHHFSFARRREPVGIRTGSLGLGPLFLSFCSSQLCCEASAEHAHTLVESLCVCVRWVAKEKEEEEDIGFSRVWSEEPASMRSSHAAAPHLECASSSLLFSARALDTWSPSTFCRDMSLRKCERRGKIEQKHPPPAAATIDGIRSILPRLRSRTRALHKQISREMRAVVFFLFFFQGRRSKNCVFFSSCGINWVLYSHVVGFLLWYFNNNWSPSDLCGL